MKKIISIAIVSILGIIAVVDLLHPGFPVTHDTQDHIARIANFYQNLSEGTLIPRWAAHLNFGYGHPILEFLYPLPSYIASFFHFLGFSFVDATKLVYALGMVASGLAMYVFACAVWGESAGIIAGALYMYAPYRFVDLYVRGDIGEHVAFVFLPLVFWGLYRLFATNKTRYILLSGLFLGLLILSHNAISLMMMPMILLYTAFLLWQKKWNKKLLLQSAAAIVLGFLLASFFWVPALLEGQYTLRNIVTKGEYVTKFVTIPALFYGPWSYQSWDILGKNNLTVQLGIVQWISFFASLIAAVYIWKKKRKVGVLLFGIIAITLVALFLMMQQSNFIWQRVILLQNFQFPWRFLAIPVFTLALLGAILISLLPSLWRKVVVGIVIVTALFLSRDYMHAKSYEIKPESFFTGIYSKTTDTGESSPIWSVRFMEQPYDKPLVDLTDNAVIVEQKRTTTMHEYAVSTNENIRLLENTLYFPGWRVLVDGQPVTIQFQDPKYRGLMTFTMPSGTHTVRLQYQESKLRLFGDTLSLVGIAVLGVLLAVALKKKTV